MTDSADSFDRLHHEVLGDLASALDLQDAPQAGPREMPQHGVGGVPVRCLRTRLTASERLDAQQFAAAMHALLAADGELRLLEKPDGEPRIDLASADGMLHSAALNHGRTVLQLTSFTPAVAGGGAGDAGDRDGAVTQILDAAADPRVLGLDLEERIIGPDYPEVP